MRFVLLGIAALLFACQRKAAPSADGIHLVFKHQPLWGDPAAFRALLADFERDNPGIRVATEHIPNATDLAHQYFLTALEGNSTDFDVFVLDVIWVQEFAKAGWISDLSTAFPMEELRGDFLPGPIDAVTSNGRTFAVPWFIDVGLLFYRADLVARSPRTYDELATMALEVTRARPDLYGFVWQGRQYEGLTCNVYEALWGHQGVATNDGRIALSTPAAAAALGHLRRLVTSGVSPPSVTSSAEEEARRLFQQGRAVFMRNWPYAWNEANAPDSPIHGKVSYAPLPTKDGEPGYGALGGWQLAINAHAPANHREAAEKLIRHLTSAEANLIFATHYHRNPPRRAVYDDPRLRERNPFIASLREVAERARPRPVTPYYNLIADVLQSEFSAALAGLRTPEEALHRAQRQVDHLMGLSP